MSFELEVLGDNTTTVNEDDLRKNSLHKKAKGGTELMLEGLQKRIDPELWNKFNFMMSRVRDEFLEDDDRPAILWLQDIPEDPESLHLKDPKSRERFAKIVCNSYWQQQQYELKLGVPVEETTVLKNACESFPAHVKPEGKKRLIYFSTPHRGLHVLEAAVRWLGNQRDDFELDVYSSFEIYGWAEKDKDFEHLYDRLRELDCVNYHGTVSNDKIRDALTQSHILAYPSTYPESSCCVAIEAMAAGLLSIMPNHAALTETGTDFAWHYNYETDAAKHAQKFATVLNGALDSIDHPSVQSVLKLQTSYYNYFYSWDMRAAQWTDFLKNTLLEIEQTPARKKYPY